MFLQEDSQYFCILVCNFSKKIVTGLDARFQQIKFVNSIVPSPCKTQPYNKRNYIMCLSHCKTLCFTTTWSVHMLPNLGSLFMFFSLVRLITVLMFFSPILFGTLFLVLFLARLTSFLLSLALL